MPRSALLPNIGFVIGLLLPAGLYAQSEGGKVPEPPSVELEGDSAAGHVTLTWRGDKAAGAYQLEAAMTQDFSDAVVRYQGLQTATVRSGLVDGDYYFRVRQRAADGGERWSDWSEPAHFKVEHHSLSLALGLLGLGALVFLVTAGCLVVGSRRVETRG